MKTITVVTLGPGNPAYLTLQAADALRRAAHLVLRTEKHRVSEWLRNEGVHFSTLDALYDSCGDFDTLHRRIAEELWKMAESHAVTYAVQDAATDGSVQTLRILRPEDGELRILPGISAQDAALASLPDCAPGAPDGLRILPASSLPSAVPDATLPMIVTELDTRELAGQAKLIIADWYGDEISIYFCPSTARTARRARQIPLCELDRQPSYDHTVCAVIPPQNLEGRNRYDFWDLVRIMARLRGENGCPWDREQTHQSLRKYLLEECYEAAGAIDEGDMDHLAEELGDVLLQIVFHADIGQSFGEFGIGDVTTAICRKMIYRHAHVFGSDHCETAEAVSENWERLKRAEQHLHSQSEVLRGVSAALPALTRAEKVQRKAAQVGFDWDRAEDALEKVTEEAGEVREELAARRNLPEELGDLLFACVNVIRLAGFDPEECLTAATEKFIRRFTAMEAAIVKDGKLLKDLTLTEMDVYWNSIKHAQEQN